MSSVVPATVQLNPSAATRIFPLRERVLVRRVWKFARSEVCEGVIGMDGGRDGGAEK